ncbi:MAG: YceI family protein [Aequorivita sp.]|nr:YceI family protein [Aequorivita sp.]
MKTFKRLKLVFGSLLVMVLTTQTSLAQTYQLSNAASTLIVDGTSNIHDWDIKAENQQGKIVVEFENGMLTKIDQLDFSVTAESLKSGKSTMDKNTYKALNTGKYKQIVYKLNKVNSINCSNNNSCSVSTTGSLTISGKTKTVDIAFDIAITQNKIILSGSKTIKMTDYGVEPPSVIFGTITTGDAVDIKFKSSFIK